MEKGPWDVFESTTEDHSTTEWQYNYYESLSPGQLAVVEKPGRQQINTVQMISRDLDAWLLLHEGYVQFFFTIQEAATGGPVDSTAVATGVAGTTGIVNLIGSSMSLFQRAELYASGQLVDYTDYCGFIQTLQSLLHENLDKVQTWGEKEWMYLDDVSSRVGDDVQEDPITTPGANVVQSAGAAEVFRYVVGGTNDYEFANNSYRLRWLKSRATDITAPSRKYVEVMVPLRKIFGFCRDITCAIQGFSWEVRLLTANDFTRIIHGKTETDDDGIAPTCNVLIPTCRLWLPQLKPSIAQQASLTEQLKSKMIATHIFNNMDCYASQQYNAGTSSGTWTVTSTTSKPTKVYVFFQKSNQYNEQNDTLNHEVINNGGVFSNMVDAVTDPDAPTAGITNVELRVNQKFYPKQRYELAFNNSQNAGYGRAYIDFLASSGKFMSDEGVLTAEQYKNLFTCFAFDLENNDDMLFSGVKQNDIQIKWQLSNTADAYKVYCVIHSEFRVEFQALDGRLAIQV